MSVDLVYGGVGDWLYEIDPATRHPGNAVVLKVDRRNRKVLARMDLRSASTDYATAVGCGCDGSCIPAVRCPNVSDGDIAMLAREVEAELVAIVEAYAAEQEEQVEEDARMERAERQHDIDP